MRWLRSQQRREKQNLWGAEVIRNNGQRYLHRATAFLEFRYSGGPPEEIRRVSFRANNSTKNGAFWAGSSLRGGIILRSAPRSLLWCAAISEFRNSAVPSEEIRRVRYGANDATENGAFREGGRLQDGII